MLFPSTACLLQNKIGATNAWGFDVSAACSAFAYSLTVGSQLIAAGSVRYALIVGADVMSSIIDYTDRTTCVLFGDGAGAVVLGRSEGNAAGILDFAHEIDGSGGAALCMPAGGSLRPASHETVDQRLHFVKQDGQTVFKFAVRRTGDLCERLLKRNNVTAADIDLFVSHQANRRIIEAVADRVGVDRSKVIINIERFGNTTAGTIPLALNDAVEAGRLKKGDLVLDRLGRRRLHGRRASGALGLLSQPASRVPHSDSGRRPVRRRRVALTDTKHGTCSSTEAGDHRPPRCVTSRTIRN